MRNMKLVTVIMQHAMHAVCHATCHMCNTAVKLHGNQLHKGRATYRVTAGCDGGNKEWKPTLLRHLYFTETQREVVGAAMTMAEWFPVQRGNYYNNIHIGTF